MNKQDIHETVSHAYTEALRRSEKGTGGCCGPKMSTSAGLAGYGDEPAAFTEAAQSSFGCGNPLAFAEVAQGQTVVDLGSGAGLDLLIGAEKVGPSGRVIGIDMTDAMIEAARNNAKKAGHDNIEVLKAKIEDLPIESASVDWVISNCVINLSPDKPAVFKEIARVLRLGGRFSISDIVVEDLPTWIRENSAAYAACVAGAISEEEYVGGLKAAGLRDIEVTERLVYDADQIRGIIAGDLEPLGMDPAFVEAGLEAITGKVWSAKFIGRR